MKYDFKIKYSKGKALQLIFQINRLKLENYNKGFIPPKSATNTLKSKVFCIGSGKTGTTSLGKALEGFGYELGNQAVGEMLTEDWYNKRYDRIIKFCHTADAFQDVPFGLQNLYKELDKAFPSSKFILTVRNNEHQWFNSLVKFHTKLFSSVNNRPPTEEDLSNALYVYKGWALDTKKLIYNYPEVQLYDGKQYKKKYLQHIKDVKGYFAKRPADLLVLNVEEKKSYHKLASFLGLHVDAKSTFPWLNKT